MGMVHDKDERNIDTSFMLDDTTGRIEVKRWSVFFLFCLCFHDPHIYVGGDNYVNV